jgi:hypothetical protein
MMDGNVGVWINGPFCTATCGKCSKRLGVIGGEEVTMHYDFCGRSDAEKIENARVWGGEDFVGCKRCQERLVKMDEISMINQHFDYGGCLGTEDEPANDNGTLLVGKNDDNFTLGGFMEEEENEREYVFDKKHGDGGKAEGSGAPDMDRKVTNEHENSGMADSSNEKELGDAMQDQSYDGRADGNKDGMVSNKNGCDGKTEMEELPLEETLGSLPLGLLSTGENGGDLDGEDGGIEPWPWTGNVNSFEVESWWEEKEKELVKELAREKKKSSEMEEQRDKAQKERAGLSKRNADNIQRIRALEKQLKDTKDNKSRNDAAQFQLRNMKDQNKLLKEKLSKVEVAFAQFEMEAEEKEKLLAKENRELKFQGERLRRYNDNQWKIIDKRVYEESRRVGRDVTEEERCKYEAKLKAYEDALNTEKEKLFGQYQDLQRMVKEDYGEDGKYVIEINWCKECEKRAKNKYFNLNVSLRNKRQCVEHNVPKEVVVQGAYAVGFNPGVQSSAGHYTTGAGG